VGDIVADFVTETEMRMASGLGPVRKRVTDAMVKIKFTPLQYNNLALLFPYATTQVGARLSTNTDQPVIITPVNGAPLTVANCLITKLPGLKLAARGAMLKELEITGLIKTGADYTAPAAGDFYSLGAVGSAVALAGYNAAQIYNGLYTLTWNGTTFYADQEGFDVEWDLKIAPVKVDVFPTLDYELVSFLARVSFTPVNMTEANYAALLPTGQAMGSDLTGYDAVIAATGGTPTVTLKNAAVNTGGLTWGAEKYRGNKLVFETIRNVTTNALAELFTVA
jgi:hypothetical protein